MSDLLDGLKGVTINLSKLKEIAEIENKYNKLGAERMERILSLAQTTMTESEQKIFILGYSECGQDMEDKLKDVQEKLNAAENVIAGHKQRELDEKIKGPVKVYDMNGVEIKVGLKVNRYPLIGKKTGEPKVRTVELIQGMHGNPDDLMIWFEEGGGAHHPEACEVIVEEWNTML